MQFFTVFLNQVWFIYLFACLFITFNLFATHLADRQFDPVVDQSIKYGIYLFVSMPDFHIKIILLFKIIILIIHIYKFTHKP